MITTNETQAKYLTRQTSLFAEAVKAFVNSVAEGGIAAAVTRRSNSALRAECALRFLKASQTPEQAIEAITLALVQNVGSMYECAQDAEREARVEVIGICRNLIERSA